MYRRFAHTPTLAEQDVIASLPVDRRGRLILAGDGAFDPGADFHVSSERGDDDNPGTYALPFATFAPVTPFAGMKLGIANGSTLWEGFSEPTGMDDIWVFNYFDKESPSSRKPVIRCDAFVPSENWTDIGSLRYQTTINLSSAIDEQYIRVYFRDRALREVDTIVGMPVGTYCVSAHDEAEVNLTVCVPLGVNLAAGPDIVYFTKEPICVDLWGDRCRITGIDGRRALVNSGSFAVRGRNCILEYCGAYDGNKHNAIIGSGIAQYNNFEAAYFGEENGFCSYLVGFLPDGSGETLTFRGNSYSIGNMKYDPQFQCGTIWHNESAESGFYEKVQMIDETYDRLTSAAAGEKTNEVSTADNSVMTNCGGGYQLLSSWTITNLQDVSSVPSGRVLTVAAEDVTVKVLGGFSRRKNFNSAQYKSDQPGTRWEFEDFDFDANGSNDNSFAFLHSDYGSVKMRRCRINGSFVEYSMILGRGDDVEVDIDDTTYADENTKFELNGDTYDTVTDWKIATDQDAGSSVSAYDPAETPIITPDLIFAEKLKMWIDFTDVDSLVVVDGMIASAMNLYGVYAVDNGTAVNRPELGETGGPLGQSAALFVREGVKFLVDGSTQFPNVAQPFICASTAKIVDDSTSGNKHFIYGIQSPQSAFRYTYYDVGEYRVDVIAGGVSYEPAPIEVDRWAGFIVKANGDESFTMIDGELATAVSPTSDIGSGIMRQATIGTGSGFGVNDSFDGAMLDVMVADGSGVMSNMLDELARYQTSRRVA